MEDIILHTAEFGPLAFVPLLTACAIACAYILLRKGLAAGLLAVLAVAYAWARYTSGKPPEAIVMAWWYGINWVCMLAFLGFLRLSAMLQSGRLRIFSSSLLRQE